MTDIPPPPPGNYPPPPPPGAFPPPPPGGPVPGGAQPDNNLVWAILSTVLCCLPLGIVSIIKSTQVSGLWASGSYAEAQQAADDAKKFALWGAIAGAVVAVLYIIFVFSSVSVRCRRTSAGAMQDTRQPWVITQLGPPLGVALAAGLVCGAVWMGDPSTPGGPLPVCPTKALLGIDCPGCGSLRMVYSLLHGDLGGAARYNALALVAVALLAWAFGAWTYGRIVGRRVISWQH